MYIFIEQLEVGARVYRKVLTNVRGTDPHIQLFPLTNSCSLQMPNLGWSSPQKPEGKKKATADWAAPRRQAELSTPWGQGFTSHPGCWPCKTLTSRTVFHEGLWDRLNGAHPASRKRLDERVKTEGKVLKTS